MYSFIEPFNTLFDTKNEAKTEIGFNINKKSISQRVGASIPFELPKRLIYRFESVVHQYLCYKL